VFCIEGQSIECGKGRAAKYRRLTSEYAATRIEWFPSYLEPGKKNTGRSSTVKAFSLLLFLFLSPPVLPAQAPEGIWQGYDGEWKHVSQQLIALAEATPAEKYAWRPAPGVRSTSEVYMHIAIANFYLLSVTGPKMPADLNIKMEKTVTSKDEVIAWLKKSLEAVKTARAAVTPKDLERKVKIADREATVDGMYLRIIVHANEHMGQLVAYARMTGVVPPWSKE
jgi:uncharacterized damage-inducible protein DinB